VIPGLVFKVLSVKNNKLIAIIVTIFCHNYVIAEVLVDPTRPPSHLGNKPSIGIKSAPKWVLSSTLIAPARRLATINGKTLMIGQMIGTAKVISIEPTQVGLRAGGRPFVLNLLPSRIKKMH